MDDSQDDAGATPDASQNGAVEDPALRADRLFASLVDQAVPERSGSSFASAPASVEMLVPAPVPTPEPRKRRNSATAPVPPAVEPPASAWAARQPAPAPSVLDDREVHELMITVLGAVERVGDVVDATTFDVATLGAAVTQALQATHDRLASLERIVLGEVGAGVEAVEQAMADLRSTLRGPAEDDDEPTGATAP